MKGWTPVAKYEHNSQLHGRQTSVFILGICSYSVSIYIEIDQQIVQKREKKSWKFGTTLLDDIVNKKK